jgi:hypothetical protein
MHGVVLAVALTAINFVESTVFLLMLPQEYWILIATVLARTLLLLLLAVEWLGQIWPTAAAGRRMQLLAARLAWVVVAAALLAALLGAPRAAQAYWERRTVEHPCREAIAFLRDEAGTAQGTIVTSQLGVWQEFYPWLRDEYTIHVLDGYDSNDRPADAVMGDKLAQLASTGEFWWVEQAPEPSPGQHGQDGGVGVAAADWSPVLRNFAAQESVTIFDELVLGACRMARVAALGDQAVLATVDSAGGPIVLLDVRVEPVAEQASNAGGSRILPLVLYWQALAPVDASYTVFTQLFDASGRLVAQQDNLPVQGLAPTDTWQPRTTIRDSYRLALPADAGPGEYAVHVGMYDAQGRRSLALADGTSVDHLSLPVRVD